MAMFVLEIAFLLALAVLAGGVVLWQQGRQAAGPLRVAGLVLIVGAVLTAACTAYYGIRYHVQGDFDHAYPMHPPIDMGRMMGPGGMMGGGTMERGPMGRPGMGGPDAGEEMARPPGVSESEHESHHPGAATP